MTEGITIRPSASDGPLAGRRLLAVFAHPDDESLACGGLLARCAAEGACVTLLCATRGEAGERVPGCSDDVGLGIVRRGELHDAAERLGIHELILLDHPDGELPGENYALFRQEMVVAMRYVRPDAVVTFGPDGLYWHPDHIYVHERVTEAVAQLAPDQPALYYVVFPKDLMKNVLDLATAHAPGGEELSLWDIDAEAFGAYAPPPTLVVDVSAYVGSKLDALRAHRSQIGSRSPFSWLTPELATPLLGCEYFARSAATTTASFLDDMGARVGVPK
ncbi:MAG TPA: PIG-L deacetylase family protein [Vicinamibacterales bacterium]|nr:PIG-L deacetylase family protein [Vicinamibacterales bacterium]